MFKFRRIVYTVVNKEKVSYMFENQIIKLYVNKC